MAGGAAGPRPRGAAEPRGLGLRPRGGRREGPLRGPAAARRPLVRELPGVPRGGDAAVRRAARLPVQRHLVRRLRRRAGGGALLLAAALPRAGRGESQRDRSENVGAGAAPRLRDALLLLRHPRRGLVHRRGDGRRRSPASTCATRSGARRPVLAGLFFSMATLTRTPLLFAGRLLPARGAAARAGSRLEQLSGRSPSDWTPRCAASWACSPPGAAPLALAGGGVQRRPLRQPRRVRPPRSSTTTASTPTSTAGACSTRTTWSATSRRRSSSCRSCRSTRSG